MDDLSWMDSGRCVEVGAVRWESMADIVKRRFCQTCPVRLPCKEFMAGKFNGEWTPKRRPS